LLGGRTFPHLQNLVLDHCPSNGTAAGELEVENADVQGVANLENLSLMLAPEMGDAVFLAAVPLMRNIKSLSLSNLKGVSDHGSCISPRPPLPNLTGFQLS
jgi:hypothetical protein